MRLVIETNAGTFAAYLNSAGEITIFQGEDETSIAVISPLVKRKAALDFSTDGVAKAVRTWLETNHARLEIDCVTVRLVPSRR